MKRFTKWLGKMFAFAKENRQITILVVLGVIAGIVLGFVIYCTIDRVPATALDYAELETQIEAIQETPDVLLKTNCSISVKDEVFTVTLSNKECKVITEFDQNFNVLSTTKTDFATNWIVTLIMSIVLAVMGGFIGFLAFVLIACLIEFLWDKFRKN